MKRILLAILLITSCSKEDEIDKEISIISYQVSVMASDGGSVSTTGGIYELGSILTITATPNQGYEFIGWTGSNETSMEITLEVNSNIELIANFQLIPIPEFTLDLSSGNGGTISGEGGIYKEGTEITITAVPDEGYSFLKWSNGSTENPLTITINSTQTISATFELIEFQFNYFIDENSLPQDWIDEFNKIDAYLKNLLPVYAFYAEDRDKNVTGIDIYSWMNTSEKPSNFPPDISGGCLCGFNDYGSESHVIMSLEMKEPEFTNGNIHRHLLYVHEYFHIYQSSTKKDVFNFSVKWLFEGAAASIESLYANQFYNFNYFNDAQSRIYQNVKNDPSIFESHDTSSGNSEEGLAYDTNYATSVFMTLALAKEIQKKGISEAIAFKKIFVDFNVVQPNENNWKTKFEEIFGLSVDEFYLNLKDYELDVMSVIPSTSLTLEDIFL